MASKPGHVLVYKVSVLQDTQIIGDKHELGLNLPICHLSEESLSHYDAITREEGETPPVQLTHESVVYGVGWLLC